MGQKGTWRPLRLAGRIWIILLGLSAISIACGLWLGQRRLHSHLHVCVAVWILAASCAYFLTVRSLSGSIDPLIEATRIWAAGDLAHRVRLKARDRISLLAGALNRMAASLQRRDESNRLRTEEKIIQTERLATVGQLAAGVAHEINNPIGGILLYGNLLLESTSADDPRRENMAKIVTQAARAREIVKGLLDFARQTPPRIDRADLNSIVTEVTRLLERHPSFQNVLVRTEVSPTPLWVNVDTSKMQQVFVNIIMNGVEAMKNGGTLTIRTGFSEREGFCRVAITDTGCGISEENIAHLFDPFFTTKEVGQGIGLGLAISYGIVQQHSGEIEVQSKIGTGTTFRVLLPVEQEST